MPEWDNTNRGVLFPNDRKESERHPDYQGSINVDGKDFQIAAWERTAKSGKAFLSISVSKPRDEYDQRPNNEVQRKEDVVVEDISNEPINLDDIPF